jgi:hypothetical protein
VYDLIIQTSLVKHFIASNNMSNIMMSKWVGQQILATLDLALPRQGTVTFNPE